MGENLSIGERIAILRKRRRLTQRELALITGISANRLTKIENHYVNYPSSQTVILLAHALGVSADLILGIEEIPDELPHRRGKA
jgi:transcriptional regulator with XRE-family HTH domain